jgi:hypothetical protein
MNKMLNIEAKPQEFNIDKWLHYMNNFGIVLMDPSRTVSMRPSIAESTSPPQIQRITCDRCGATKIENTECDWCGM